MTHSPVSSDEARDEDIRALFAEFYDTAILYANVHHSTQGQVRAALEDSKAKFSRGTSRAMKRGWPDPTSHPQTVSRLLVERHVDLVGELWMLGNQPRQPDEGRPRWGGIRGRDPLTKRAVVDAEHVDGKAHLRPPRGLLGGSQDLCSNPAKAGNGARHLSHGILC